MDGFDELGDAEKRAITKALRSDAFKNLIGAQEWDLSEREEHNLWSALEKLAAD